MSAELRRGFPSVVAALALCAVAPGSAMANGECAPVPGGTQDPCSIPKYVTPLVVPPVMNDTGVANDYQIAVRQFQQQILPGGFPATTVWSYGPAADPLPAVAPDPTSQFNYPAYTIETIANVPVDVRWINGLVDDAGGYLPHLLPLDQTLHWANPPATGCRDGSARTDCATDKPDLYTGPVPIVTHVHGSHVDSHSDGYPEAWWLPAANNIDASYARSGRLFDDATGLNDGTLGYADFHYRNDQPATTLWYHDHSLGMTRLNVYAGPAGFWLIRGGGFDQGKDGVTGKKAVLPGPAPVAGQTVLELNSPEDPARRALREIPIVIQDRSFDANGDLFYPENRAFFEGLNPEDLEIDFVPDSDIAPTWNPEAFFNVMVVNGVSWPSLEVAPAVYRLRLLNGCNSRFLNLSLQIVEGESEGEELPLFQIGAEQGFLPRVVRITTGEATPLPGDGSNPDPVEAGAEEQALLMGLAERADVIVDFSGLQPGTKVRMINTAPDAPFGGFGDEPADPGTTGQVMQFVVNPALSLPSDAAVTSPYALVLKAEKGLDTRKVKQVRRVSLNEGESEVLCVRMDGDKLVDAGGTPPDCPEGSEPFAPKEALLGLVDLSDPDDPRGIPLHWTDESGASTAVPVTLQSGLSVDVLVSENPVLGQTEEWEIYNFTEDAHPIHLHLVRFEVVGRSDFQGGPSGLPSVQPWETGFKDTVIAYPGEITRVRAKFDIEGLYVWHCHIVEHEDNEMMRPFVVSGK